MAQFENLLRPLQIQNLIIRNRLMSTSHAPGYNVGGIPSERYIRYHEEKAKGGIGLTMVGGSSSISVESPSTPWGQLKFSDDSIIEPMAHMVERIHTHGAKIMCQISHMGRRARYGVGDWFAPIGPSSGRDPSHRSIPKVMEDWDIDRVIKAYGQAARRCMESGLDGCEVLIPHLPAQFLSPHINQRTDKYGGSLENRMRFSLELFEEMRKQTKGDFLIGMRSAGDEFYEYGVGPEESMEFIVRHVSEGLVDFINVIGGQAYTERLLAETVTPGMAFPVAPFIYLASQIKQEVDVPVFHATRITDIATANRAIEEGHMDMVAMTRAHMADPYIGLKLMENRPDDIRQCVGAGYCIDRIYNGGDACCIQNAATGREELMPHVIKRTSGEIKKVVIIGGGPAGLEAARVSASKGHEVILFEKEDRCGGQINIIAKSGWREAMSGITRWLFQQVTNLGVDIRTGVEVTKEMVLAEKPDVVIVATGGRPNKDIVKGSEHAVSTWDILNGTVELGQSILLYDDEAANNGPTTASFISERGAYLEIVTPDRNWMPDVGNSNYPVFLQKIYQGNSIITPDHVLREIYMDGNKLIAVLRNDYTDEEEEREVDQIILERGTLSVDGLYFELRPHSKNHGDVNLPKLTEGIVEFPIHNEVGDFDLIRVGDAVASRNIHAAIYDSLRICQGL